MSDNDEQDRLIGELFKRDSAKPSRPINIEPVCRYCDVLPVTAKIIAALLTKEGYDALAEQVPALMIFDRCRCEAPHCASFHTQPKTEGPYGPTHWGFMLPSPDGMMIFDVLGETIAFIEILDFPLASVEVAENCGRYFSRQASRMGVSTRPPF
jgi:hypothetical protein